MISEHIFGVFLLTAAPEAPKIRLKYTEVRGGEGTPGIVRSKKTGLKNKKYGR
jgi:hypothetical protein